MTDTPAQPNEEAPTTRSGWLALIREAVRLELAEQRLRDAMRKHGIPPQPPSEG